MMAETTSIATSVSSPRERQVLCGLYLSKHGRSGLRLLGFETFTEAYNVMGFALKTKPASIKNYRDEFDPLFPNSRKGWRNRGVRDYCLAVFERYEALDLQTFGLLVKSFFTQEYLLPEQGSSEETDSTGSFANRLITGLAAEKYFEAVHSQIEEFSNKRVENTTQLGCGYDFRLDDQDSDIDFLAVEVKGLRNFGGTLTMTSKEHHMASQLRDRFFLFVVRNFQEKPSHTMFRDPLDGPLEFSEIERVIIQLSWTTRLGSRPGT